MKFKTSSGIKSIVGRDLITDPYVAIFELVKNSYDANATQVIVSFNTNKYSIQETDCIDQSGTIYIVDNGHGMSKNDLENKWLHLAYSDKKEGTNENKTDNSLTNKRNYVGSKGIGRFSSDRLGALLKIKTKVAYEKIEHQLIVNWDQFDANLEKRFEDIEVEYRENYQPSISEFDSYTIIEISELRNIWNEEDLNHVAEKLERLKNPFLQDDDLEIYFGKNIFDGIKFNQNKKNIIKNKVMDAIKEKSINISGKIVGNSIDILLVDRGKIVYQLTKIETQSILSNIDKIEFSINYLTQSGKASFAKKMGMPPVKYGNIFIYRNGFRVSPYGDKNHDIFNLNLRKTQGHSRYLGGREIIGFINIKDSHNFFKEASSRNHGFIENGYFKELENFYIDNIHRPLEAFTRLIKFGEIKVEDSFKETTFYNMDLSVSEKETFKRYITRNGFNIVHFDENINFDENKPENIIKRLENTIISHNQNNSTINKINKQKIQKDIQKVQEQIKTLKKENNEADHQVKKAQKQVGILKNQNLNLLNKRTDQSYGENITHHFNILAENLGYSLENLMNIKSYIPADKIEDFNKAINDIQLTKLEIEVFRKLLLNTNFDLKAKTSINWFDTINWYLKQGGRGSFYKKDGHDFQVICSDLSDHKLEKWIISSPYVDFIMMVENFYKNAFEHGATFIQFDFYENKLEIISDSQPIDDINLNLIFQLGFSTKQNGTGIGLYQIKNFVEDVKLNIQVTNKDGLVCFIIYF